jgi:hypothetical protein
MGQGWDLYKGTYNECLAHDKHPLTVTLAK